jgi:hypothetical protein
VFFQENGHDEITIKAMGRAISKTVMVAELIKVSSSNNLLCLNNICYESRCCFFANWYIIGHQRRVAGLHQNTSTESIDITDRWEPLEEGLLPYGCT